MIPIRDSLRSTQTPRVVYALIGVNVLVFLYQIALPEQAGVFLTYQYGVVPMRYSNPYWAYEHGLSSTDYFPFFTGIFLHGGFLHILFNMWTLFIFGSSLEARMGHGPFFFFYMLCGLAASIVHASFNQYSDLPAIGASGAIAGVIGAYAVAFPHARLVLIFFLPPFLEVRAMWFAVFWFLVQIVQGAEELAKPSMGGGVAWWAHVGGFMTGMALAPFFPAHRIGGSAPRSKPSESASASVSAEGDDAL
jgi:membrane associated rhomboid family serine protease